MTELTRRIGAPPAAVFAALLDPDDVRRWMVPDGMTSEIHSFDRREGGTFRISLTYDDVTREGKTGAQTDTFHGRFVKVVPSSEVVQVVEFETDDPSLQGEMTVTYLLVESDGSTIVTGRHDRLPPGVSATDNELGWRMSMDQLAALVESRSPDERGRRAPT